MGGPYLIFIGTRGQSRRAASKLHVFRKTVNSGQPHILRFDDEKRGSISMRFTWLAGEFVGRVGNLK
jgi:hypothetical protein